MNKIKNVSLFFKFLFQIIFVCIPILLVVSWIYAPEQLNLFDGFLRLSAIPASYSGMHVYIPGGIPEKVLLHALSSQEKIYGFLASLIPMAVQMFILYYLIRLFSLYAKGEIFSLNNVRYIRNIGFTMLIGQILVDPIYQTLMGVILTLHNPHGHRYASITLDQTNIGILLVSLMIILISWIMAEGRKLYEEHQLTI